MGRGTQYRCYEPILEQIREMIVGGVLKAGDRFPSERDLAERFHVSRVPVREAMKILEYIGVLEMRSDGAYVRNVGVSDILTKMTFAFTVTNQAVNDLMELRCELECIGASFAAQRRTSDDIEEMERTLRAMKRLAGSSAELTSEEQTKLREYSHHFHECVVKATKNSVFIQMYQSLYELLDISMQYTGISSGSTKAYEQILLNIVDRNSEEASAVMREHIAAAKRKLARQMLESSVADTRDLEGVGA